MCGCWILKRVWSVCAHDQAERVWCDNLDCVEVVLDTHTELMIGWCPTCEAHYTPANVRSEVVILNYWQYKTRCGLDKPVPASFVPLKDTPPSPFEERVRSRVECHALANAVITQTSQPSLSFASVLKHIEYIRAQTLEWARGAPATADAMKPRELHLATTDLETSAQRIHFDDRPRASRSGRKSWRPASPYPSALPAIVFEAATASNDDEEEEVSLSPLDREGEAEQGDSVLIPVKLDLSTEDVLMPAGLFERRAPVSPRRVPLPPSPPSTAIVPLKPTIYSPSVKSNTPSTRSSSTWTSSSSSPVNSSPGGPRSSPSHGPSAPPRPRTRLSSCPVHRKSYDVRGCPTCAGLMLDERTVAPAGRREVEAMPLCICGGRGRCFHCLLREGRREEKQALGMGGWI